jgi:hypothetical protein
MNSLPAITRILELEQVGLVLLKPPIEIQRIRTRGLFRAIRPPTKRGGNLCEGRFFVHAHIDSTNGTAAANRQQEYWDSGRNQTLLKRSLISREVGTCQSTRCCARFINKD